MKKINQYAVGAALGLSLLLPLLAMAALPEPILTSPSDIALIITGIYNWIVGIIFVVAIIMVLYAAFLYMTAGASETTLGKSKTALIYAIIGIAVAVLALSIKPFLITFFGHTF